MRTGFTRAGERQRRDPDLTDTQLPPAPDHDDAGDRDDRDGSRTARDWRWAYLLLEAAAWVGGSLLVFAAFLRVSRAGWVNSDGANSVLEGEALVHGHLLLHGWLIGDATFYFFELPLNGITQLALGAGNYAVHVASALVYLLVAISAAALAVTGSRGPARAVRAAVIVIMMAAPLLSIPGLRLMVEEPDHIGTAVFIFVSFLLVERLPERRFTPPLLCVILFAGQFGDATVRYVAVPAVVLVCGYRALLQRRLRSPDAALVAAALVSVPLALGARAVMVHLGGYWAPQPRTQLVSPAMWPSHLTITWQNLRQLYGAAYTPDARMGHLGVDFAMACLLVSAAAMVWVVCTWPRRGRAEQMLVVAVAVNIAAYIVTVLPTLRNSHELLMVLPIGAVLAARVFVPARIGNVFVALALVAATALAAALPLASATIRPLDRPNALHLISWLRAHHLNYGLGGYWDAASTTVQAGSRVHILSVNFGKVGVGRPNYELNISDYDPALHDARFVITDLSKKYPVKAFEQTFGKPSQSLRLGDWSVLVYKKNLLLELPPRHLAR
jgi:hypothetical protein